MVTQVSIFMTAPKNKGFTENFFKGFLMLHKKMPVGIRTYTNRFEVLSPLNILSVAYNHSFTLYNYCRSTNKWQSALNIVSFPNFTA